MLKYRLLLNSLLIRVYPKGACGFSYVFKRACSNRNGVRVRFAPSPTGNLHLGGLRTALYNYLFARQKGGKFILRIEDTDQKRLKPGSEENLQRILYWAGIAPDESPIAGGPKGPYTQSKRLERYKEKTEELLQSGHAYKCFCSETRLELIRKKATQQRLKNFGYDNKCRHLSDCEVEEFLRQGQPYTVRFKISSGPMTFNDLVFGSHTLDISENEGDFIIMKSDGYPTYHFACVVDDHEMCISHVLRGAEWLASTTKHIMLHEAFGWDPPSFAHLPLLINSDRTKLSKRQESLSIDYFKQEGYEPLALLNFLTSVGGGFGHTSCEVFSLDELCEKFNLSEVNTHPCILDMPKLDSYSQNYLIKQLSDEQSTNAVILKFKSMLKESDEWRYQREGKDLSDSFIEKILHLYKERISTLTELVEPELQYIWSLPSKETVQNQLHQRNISESTAVQCLTGVIKTVAEIPEPNFTKEVIGKALKKCCEEEERNYANYMLILRIILTGVKNGPAVGEILSLLGREQSLKRLKCSVESFEIQTAEIRR